MAARKVDKVSRRCVSPLFMAVFQASVISVCRLLIDLIIACWEWRFVESMVKVLLVLVKFSAEVRKTAVIYDIIEIITAALFEDYYEFHFSIII
jgi:hypothetical protein